MAPGTKNMTAGCTVSADYAHRVVELAVSRGASAPMLTERAGMRAADLRERDARIPLATFIALVRAAKVLCDDPAFALHFGELVDVFESSIVGLIGRSCATLAEAFEQMNRYGRLVAEVDLGTRDRYQLVQAADGVWVVDNRTNPNEYPEITESSFARMIGTSRRLGKPEFVKAVQVTHPEPAYRAEYDRIFQVPVVFGSDHNAIVTDPAWMTLPPTRDPAERLPRYVFGILSAHADALLESLQSSRSTRGRVESALIPILHTGNARMHTIAVALAQSRQTLFRRLKAEGVTFEQVLDELRHRMALHYLNGKKVSVNQTAYLLGFSDPAAFSRAFKRWTGSSPRDRHEPCTS